MRHIRHFTACAQRYSQIGRAPIDVPSGVDISRPLKFTLSPHMLHQRTVTPKSIKLIRPPRYPLSITVRGPRGELSLPLPSFLSISVTKPRLPDDDRKLSLNCAQADIKEHRTMWGTTRSLLQSHVVGVSEGHVSVMTFKGVGYRAALEGDDKLILRVGFTYPVTMNIPATLRVTCPTPVRVIVEGNDKQAVGQFCASVRRYRPPEPYKGKVLLYYRVCLYYC